MPWHSQSISNLVSNEIRFVVVVVVFVFVFFCFVIGYNMTHGPLFYPIKRKILTLTAGLAAIIVTIIIFTSLLFLLYFDNRLRATLPLQFFLLYSTDRDECSVKGSCPMANSYCVNTFGSYKCLCNKGYNEVYDAKKKLLKCQGMVKNCSCYVSSLIASFFTKDHLVCRPFHCHFKTSRERLLE